jgi:hypothetical protein
MKDFDEDSLIDSLAATYQITSDSGPYRAHYENLHSGFDEIDEILLEQEREIDLEIARDSYIELCISGRVMNDPLFLYSPQRPDRNLQEAADTRIEFGTSYDQTVPVEVVGHEYQNFDLSVPTFDSFRREAVRALEEIQEEP